MYITCRNIQSTVTIIAFNKRYKYQLVFQVSADVA